MCWRLRLSLTVLPIKVWAGARLLMPPQDGAAALTRASEPAVMTVSLPPIEWP